MKLHIFILIILFFSIIQATDSPKDTIISIEDSAWELTERIFESNGEVVEKYHLKHGPKKLPLEFHISSWLAATPCCCCSRSVHTYLQNYKNQYIDVSDHKRRIYKEYYPYAKPPT